MLSIHDQLPRYIIGKYQLIWTCTFTALFALVFILLRVPFAHNAWFELEVSQAFSLTVIFILISAFIVIASKMLIYRRRNDANFTVLHYVLWSIAEVLAVSAVYTYFTHQAVINDIIDIHGDSYDKIFFSALAFTIVAIGVPNAISVLYHSYAHQNNTIRLMNYGNVVSDTPAKPYEEKRITLFDNNGVLKFSINSENLYFIESDDNYIKVWYSDSDGEIKQYMLRCRLKTIEESFADSDLVRCHRKYVVNITKVEILRAEKEGYRVSLSLEGIDYIPISKTYEKNVLARFNSQ